MDTRSKPSARLAFNPHVAALPAYNAGMSLGKARALSGKHDIARLGSNENPYGCSPKVLEALASPAFEPWRYADPACAELRDVLAAHVGVGGNDRGDFARLPAAGFISADGGAEFRFA